MVKNFWEDRNVLVTGATGFIGSWLTETLLKKQARITVLIREGDPYGIEAISKIINNVRVVYGDIRDILKVEKIINGQEIIFHLAAITQVLYSIKKPVETFEVNVSGTQNILECMRKSGGKHFLVYVSTDKVYGEPVYLPIDEKHPLSSKSPYDASKLSADRLVNAYSHTYGMSVAILRWANTYGGRDANALRVIPDFITSAMNGKPLTIRGNGKHVRDFTYVPDIIEGLLLVAEKSNISNGEVFNFGSEKPTSIEELAHLIIRLMGYENKLKVITLSMPTPGEIDRQYLSCKKAEESLKWKPRVDLVEGLLMTIKWYGENPWWQNVMKRVKSYYDIGITG